MFNHFLKFSNFPNLLLEQFWILLIDVMSIQLQMFHNLFNFKRICHQFIYTCLLFTYSHNTQIYSATNRRFSKEAKLITKEISQPRVLLLGGNPQSSSMIFSF